MAFPQEVCALSVHSARARRGSRPADARPEARLPGLTNGLRAVEVGGEVQRTLSSSFTGITSEVLGQMIVFTVQEAVGGVLGLPTVGGTGTWTMTIGNITGTNVDIYSIE